MQLSKSHLVLATTLIAWSVVAVAAQSPPEKPKVVVAAEEASKAPPLDVATCQACHETALSKPFLKSYHAGWRSKKASLSYGAAEHSRPCRREGRAFRLLPRQAQGGRAQHGLPDLPREREAGELARRCPRAAGLSLHLLSCRPQLPVGAAPLKTAQDPATCYTATRR